jgi:hypothetical protein
MSGTWTTGAVRARARGVRRNFYTCADIGASAAVFIDGEPVVDLWGGYVDATLTRPFERDSIVQLFSSTEDLEQLGTWRGLLFRTGPVGVTLHGTNLRTQAQLQARLNLGLAACGCTEGAIGMLLGIALALLLEQCPGTSRVGQGAR